MSRDWNQGLGFSSSCQPFCFHRALSFLFPVPDDLYSLCRKQFCNLEVLPFWCV